MGSQSKRPLRVGLTGGIASGKSAVSQLFENLGVPVIDTDVIAREVVEPGTDGLRELVDAFGDRILQPDGQLDRAALRERAFGDKDARARLESLLHPRIRQATLAAAEAISDAPYLIIVVPLLAETGFDSLVDRVLVVDCPVELQRKRLLSRDTIDGETADAMIRSQASREARLAIADDVVTNDGELAALGPRVEALHEHYRSMAGP